MDSRDYYFGANNFVDCSEFAENNGEGGREWCEWCGRSVSKDACRANETFCCSFSVMYLNKNCVSLFAFSLFKNDFLNQIHSCESKHLQGKMVSVFPTGQHCIVFLSNGSGTGCRARFWKMVDRDQILGRFAWCSTGRRKWRVNRGWTNR